MCPSVTTKSDHLPYISWQKVQFQEQEFSFSHVQNSLTVLEFCNVSICLIKNYIHTDNYSAVLAANTLDTQTEPNSFERLTSKSPLKWKCQPFPFLPVKRIKISNTLSSQGVKLLCLSKQKITQNAPLNKNDKNNK